MYIASKISKQRLLALLFVMFNMALTYAQDFPLTVNTSVTQPYGRDAFFYYNNLKVTIINPSVTQDASLHIEFKGDNGVYLRTSDNYNPFDIVLQAGSPNILQAIDLQSYFDTGNLVATGISIPQLQQNGLPPGQYQICVRVKIGVGQFLSESEPLGCGYFTLNAAEPPQLINPICGDEITTGNNNIVFSWTIPTGVLPTYVEYTLKIIELLPNQDPNQAFLASTVPAFYEKTVYTQNTILYGPTDPPLEAGKRYAWRVIAKEAETNTPFLNGGKSEVCWFTWKPATIAIIPLVTAQPKAKKPSPTFTMDVQPLPISSLKGKLLYKFKETQMSLFIPTTNDPGNTKPSNNNQYVDANPVMNVLGSKPPVPKVGYDVSTSNAKPLAGVSVSLVVTYLFNGKDNKGDYKFEPANGQQVSYMSAENQKSFEQILATTITGADGSFNFAGFINPHEDYGLVQPDINATQNSDVQNLWMKGDMYKVLRLKVNNQYYLSPDINITINPWEAKDIGEVVSLVKSYNLKVKAKWIKGAMDTDVGAEGILTGVKLNLVRNHIPNHIPTNEGERENIQSRTVYTVVGEGESTPNGVVFRNLVQHNPNDSKDRYIIMTTASETSNVTYKNDSKSYKPNSTSTKYPYTFPKYGPTNGNYIGTLLGSNITWNHELIIEDYEDTIELVPNKPRIHGKVQTADVKSKKMSNEWVILLNEKKDLKSTIPIFQTTKTDGQGRYRFDALEMEIEDYNPNTQLAIVKGPKRTLFTHPKGFDSKKNFAGILKWGSQFVSPDADFNLEPDGFLNGYVVDDQGKAVKAKLNVEDLTMYETKFGIVNTGNNNNGNNNNNSSDTYRVAIGQLSETFSFKAPSGQRQLTVKAVNAENYGVYSAKINIPKTKTASSEPLKIVLNRKIKRIKFRVVEYKKSYARGETKVIAGAKVTLKNIPTFETPKLTDKDGYVTFEFSNLASDFSFKIEPPQGKEGDYTTETFNVPNLKNTTELVNLKVDAHLKPTAKINGIVSLNGQPLKDAKVYLDNIGSALSNDKGQYTLKGIAQDIGTIQLWASKPGATPSIVSESKELTIAIENTVNFDLKIDKEVSITNIFGFQVDIKSKEKQSDGTYLIKEANLINIPSNDNFKIREENVVLPFTNLKIKKTGTNDSYGTPIFEPAESSVSLNDKLLELKLNAAFNATLGNGSEQLKVTSINNKGLIKGKVGIDNNSFNTSNITLSSEREIYLSSGEGSTDMDVVAIGIDIPKKEKFGVVNPVGKELNFKLGQFNAKAKQDKSNISTDKITLYTYLTTNTIAGMTPNKLEIEAGNLILKPTEIVPISNSNPLKFKLEKWNFESKNWVFNTTNLRIEMQNGLIKTGTIDVPVKYVTISHDAFDIGEFKLNELSLGGVTKLNVVGNQASFGLNSNVGSDNQSHWELRLTGENGNPAATATLPGFQAGKTINFKLVSLLSNGEQQTGIANNDYMRFYNIIDVQPTSISYGDGYLDLASMTNLGIPRIPERAGFIRFKKENGQVVVQVAPMPFTIDAPGKVKLSVGNKPEDSEVRENFFKAIGTLTDEEGINLKASIQKTTTKTHIEIEPNQKMQLGGSGTSFKAVEGGIEIDKTTNDWKKLVFSGELDGFKGVKKGKRQTFTVHGAITASDESIDVNNINTPFGNLAITYDIKNSRFLGDININQPIGGMQYVGSANLLMGSQGWYFTSGGIATPPGIGAISVGLIIGDSDYLPTEVSNTLMQYAYDKQVPPTIKNGVSGLFITGRKDVPISIPNWKIDLGVVSAAMGANAGLDARVWMNFNQSGNIYGIGAMAFAHVYFKASSITCTHFSASAKAELGVKGDYNTATKAFSIDGCGSIAVGGRFEQCFPIPFAGCKGCIGTSISKGVRLDLHLDSNGKTDMAFGFGGNCSGATSGW